MICGIHGVSAARLPVALRGYRFAETDRLLDRLAEELDRRDAEIARLRGRHDEEHERTLEQSQLGRLDDDE